MNGFLNIYKSKGVSSARCLSKVKKIINCKCGHLGTLDPLASGILPVAIGQAARLFDLMLDKEKKYIAEFTFGYQTNTLDLEGEVDFLGGTIPTKQQIIDILPDFLGKIDQIPPMFSAKCVGGTKSYKLARQGKTVELKPKTVEIFDIKLLKDNSPSFVFEITCGGGTYIRSICRDIAQKLSTFATMTALERVACGYFTKENSISVEQLENLSIDEILIKSDEVLSYEKIVLEKSKAIRLLNGLYDDYDYKNGIYRVYCEDEFWGVGQVTDGKIVIKPYVRG